MRCIIAPSILACDLARFGESIQAVEKAGADWHHVDVMDGHFVPNLTFGPDIVSAIKRVATQPLDVHLMIDDPDRYAEEFAHAGASILTFHIEAVRQPRALLARIRKMGVRPGLVVKPDTPISSVFPFLDECDLVLVMTVEPGFTGQKFMPQCLKKIAELRRHAGPKLDIEVDGGLNSQTVERTARAGANAVVAGAAVYRAKDVRAAITGIREAAQRCYRDEPELVVQEE